MVSAHEAGPPPQPVDSQASNGEIVPDDDASAETLRHTADTHPASDHEPPADGPADGAGEGVSAEEMAALAAGGERTSTRAERTEIEGPNSA